MRPMLPVFVALLYGKFPYDPDLIFSLLLPTKSHQITINLIIAIYNPALKISLSVALAKYSIHIHELIHIVYSELH